MVFVFFAVKICKQCLQTASASEGLTPSLKPPTGASPLDRTKGLPSLDPLGYSPRNENSWCRYWAVYDGKDL